jgi:hypothetical protein
MIRLLSKHELVRINSRIDFIDHSRASNNNRIACTGDGMRSNVDRMTSNDDKITSNDDKITTKSHIIPAE